MKNRYLKAHLVADLQQQKMVFLAGPRQVGKTTLAEELLNEFSGNAVYMNWDDELDRQHILRGQFPGKPGLLVLDEIHKYSRWRNVLKGLYDKRRRDLQILVTGSARLDFYRRGGDSLQGRYFMYRLHPLSVAELNIKANKGFESLQQLGGFPEPFFKGDIDFKNRWSLSYSSRLIREDLASVEQLRDVVPVELLAHRLPELVGSPLSLNSLREDLQVAHQSVVRWCDMLERLYYIFRLAPFGAPRIRAVKKEQKHYHYDWTLVSDSGYRFENLVACHLKKWCHFVEDTKGRVMELRYFRDQEGREVDFVIVAEKKPILFIECKTGDKQSSPHLLYLKRKFPAVEAIQLTAQAGVDFKDRDDIRHLSAVEYLRSLV